MRFNSTKHCLIPTRLLNGCAEKSSSLNISSKTCSINLNLVDYNQISLKIRILLGASHALNHLPWLTYLDENYDRFQSELIQLLRIPSISHDPAYKENMDKAANWLAGQLRSMGLNNVEILPTGDIPLYMLNG